MLEAWKANLGRLSSGQAKLSSSNTDQYITTDSLTYYYSHAAFLSGFITAVPFIVRTDSIRTLHLILLFKALTITKLKFKITKSKLSFNCYKKHTLTHLSLVIRTVLAYILFTHYNNPFTITVIIKCIFDSELLHSVCLARMCVAACPLAKAHS